MSDPKSTLHHYLRGARESIRWKLDGLGEYDLRRPLTPTGTNLLGLLKHVASVEYEYFGHVFGRPGDEEFPWFEEDAEPNADMWATADERTIDLLAFADRAAAHADATIDALHLDSEGHVPWWPDDRNPVTLHDVLVHVVAEMSRHVGHADIVRELIDGAVGLRADVTNLPNVDADWWQAYVAQVEAAALDASRTT